MTIRSAKPRPDLPLVERVRDRVETRTATVWSDIDWLEKSHRWPTLAAIGRVVRVREQGGKTSSETAFHPLSQVLAPERLNAVVRQHWGIENRLHWRLDMVMNEDQDRTRMGHGPENLAVLRHMVLNAMQRKAQKAHSAESSNEQGGTMLSSHNSSQCFEMRLP